MSNVILTDSHGKVLPYKRLKFAGGEIHVNVGDMCYDFLRITSSIRSSDDLIEVLLLKDALSRNSCKWVSLHATYLPYARQDRVCTKGDSFSLLLLTGMINAAQFYKVVVTDCHSPVGINLLDNCHNRTALDCLDFDGFQFVDGEVVVLAPDAGALGKSLQIANSFGYECLTASKKRDAGTGALTGFQLNCLPEELEGKHVYIFDDICDGGGTFLGLGKLVQECKPESMHLHVTNGIFSNPEQYKSLNEMYQLTATYNWIK